MDRRSLSFKHAIEVSYLKSLYEKPKSILVGASLQVVAVMLAYLETGSVTYPALAVLIFAFALFRYLAAVRFHHEDVEVKTERDILYWERLNFHGVAPASMFIGLFAFLGIYYAPGNYAALAGTMVVCCTSATIVGKYYGSRALVSSLMVLISLPLISALAFVGNYYYFALAILAVPFSMVVTSLAAGIRNLLFEAATKGAEAEELADRFTLALNNMPHGLVMVNNQSRVMIMNDRGRELLGFSPDVDINDRPIKTLVRAASYKSSQGDRNVEGDPLGAFDALLNGDAKERVTIETSDDRILEFSHKHEENGGAVLIFEDVTDRIKADERIRFMACYDDLTGLCNRAYFKDLAHAAFADGVETSSFGLFILDVDHFKTVNDSYGHHAGDALLVEIANRLNQFKSEGITISRLAGDEFVILHANMKDENDARYFASRICQMLNGDYWLIGERVSISISLGFVYDRGENIHLQTQMVRADLALYACKEDLDTGFVQFEQSMDEKYHHRQRLKNDLQFALANNGLNVIYQPVIDVETQRIVACEALSRWHHAELGPISPGEYIPLAEETGLITEITKSVLRQSCLDCATWSDDLSVSVNLSAIDFQSPDLINHIRAALDESGLDPSRLEVEVTETAALADADETNSVLKQLRALGLSIALDDFGTGYSGLSYLHSLPLDRMKIDRSFVIDVETDQRSVSLLRGVLTLAEELDLKVTVEGVETVEGLEIIVSSGKVGRIQGFVFGAHLPGSAIAEFGARKVIAGQTIGAIC